MLTLPKMAIYCHVSSFSLEEKSTWDHLKGVRVVVDALRRTTASSCRGKVA